MNYAYYNITQKIKIYYVSLLNICCEGILAIVLKSDFYPKLFIPMNLNLIFFLSKAPLLGRGRGRLLEEAF